MHLKTNPLIGIGLAISVFAVFCGIWQASIAIFDVHPIILPSPLRVLKEAWKERAVLQAGFIATGIAALTGLTLSLVIGSFIAILFSQSRWIRAAFYPYVMFLQTVPIVAIAPLVITWFDYGFQTVVLIALIISLFPIISNVTAGLISIDDNLRDLFRLHGASRVQTLVKLQIPHAVSHLVLGARISAGLAVIGAIIGEFFVGAQATENPGLGIIMGGWQNLGNTSGLVAVVFVSTLLGLVVLSIVNLVAKFLLGRWTASNNFETE